MTKLWERQSDETPKSYEAFCLYRDMGSNRSLEKVCEQFYGNGTVNLRYVEEWSSKYQWVDRVLAYDDYREQRRRERLEKKQAELETQLLLDALEDYEALLKQWREAHAQVKYFIREGLTTDKQGNLVRTLELDTRDHAAFTRWRDEIDKFGRRAIGLPERIEKQEHEGSLGISFDEAVKILNDHD